MFAIIRTGAKQYRAEEGGELLIEKLDAAPGSTYSFTDVLLIGPKPLTLGRPLVAGASVEAEILGVERGPKVIAIRYKAKKDLHKKRGHRQSHTRVRVTSIKLPSTAKAAQTPAKASATS